MSPAITETHAAGAVDEGRVVPLRADPTLSTTWISWLRVVAIAGVVIIHTNGATAVAPGARSSAEGIIAIILYRGFNFAVPAFVMVSGALLLDPAKYRGDATFLKKRAARLVPAIVFWHLFYWGLRVTLLHQHVSARTAFINTLNGHLFTALYFFWIVFGLALVSPFLIAWLRTATRRAALIAGGSAVLIPVLTAATVKLRGAPLAWVETPWTWWIPYLGLYILGWALRGVRLRAWSTAASVLLAVSILAFIAYNFGRDDSPSWFRPWFDGYYSLGSQGSAILIFLAFQSLIRPGGALGLLAQGAGTRYARIIGDCTLGIFALHLAVLYVSYELPLLAGDAAAQTLRELFGRTAFVLLATTAIVLVARRVPVLKRLF